MAVCSVVYEPKVAETEETEEADIESENEASSEDEAEDLTWSEEQDESFEPVINHAISGVISKVNKIVNMFRKSPKLWEKLLKRTEEDPKIGEKLGLLKQCKTRW